MPALSSTMTEGKIVSWVKSEGDKLSKGESVVVVESDKADMDVETFYDGYLAAIMVEEGGVAAVGSPIALLAEREDEIDQAKSKANSSSSSSSSPPPPAAELTPSSLEPQSEKIPDNVGPSSVVKASPSVIVASTHPASEGGKRIVASPYAKKLAKELKVELGRIVGTGPLGRIVAKDVEAAAASAAAVSSPRGADTAATAPGKSAGIELGSMVPFTTMQNAVSRNMVESLAVPTFRVGYTFITDALDALYKKVRLSRKIGMSGFYGFHGSRLYQSNDDDFFMYVLQCCNRWLIITFFRWNVLNSFQLCHVVLLFVEALVLLSINTHLKKREGDK